jgi:hypothetical protein
LCDIIIEEVDKKNNDINDINTKLPTENIISADNIKLKTDNKVDAELESPYNKSKLFFKLI